MGEVLQLENCDHNHSPSTNTSVIAFSAGVVGAIAAAQYWHHRGIAISHFIAIDGWGVPLAAEFPIYRISHDHFTHWSSALLGAGQVNFYADPAVDHLDLWQTPDQTLGYVVRLQEEKRDRLGRPKENHISAAQFIRNSLSGAYSTPR